jgi:hypothetical protein
MAASYFGKKAPYGFVMEVTLLYVFILWLCSGRFGLFKIRREAGVFHHRKRGRLFSRPH